MAESHLSAAETRRDIWAIDRLLLRIRRRETPFYDRLYRIGMAARHVELPRLRAFYKLLYYERRTRLTAWGTLVRVLYNQPLFMSRCDRVGKGLVVWGGVPVVLGHLKIRIGDYCNIAGVTTFGGSKLAEEPVLEIGDHSIIGCQTAITVGTSVRIGKHVGIANRCLILGADNHPVDPIKRRTQPEQASALRPLVIEDDAWVASESVIHRGVTIGKGAVVAAGSVVTRDVPPYTVVAGNPARVIWRIPRPVERPGQ